MKIFAFILSLSLVVGALLPCSFTDDCHEAAAAKSATVPAEKNKCGDCSPFAACCAFAVAVPVSLPLDQPAMLAGQPVYAAYSSQIVPAYGFALFQPPRPPAVS